MLGMTSFDELERRLEDLEAATKAKEVALATLSPCDVSAELCPPQLNKSPAPLPTPPPGAEQESTFASVPG